MNPSLSDRVSKAEEHAEEYESRKDVESKVEDEKDDLISLTDQLESLEEEVQKLIWYESILNEVFDQDNQNADSETELVREFVCDEVVESTDEIINQDLSVFEDECSEVKKAVEEMIEVLGGCLEEEKEKWEHKIANTRKIIQIPGLLTDDAKSELEDVSQSIEDFVTTEIWDVRTEEGVSGLKEDWQSLTSKFNNHRTIHGYENVQEEYEISDETVEIIKELIEGGETELQKFEPVILEDLKKFDKFAKQVKVSFKS